MKGDKVARGFAWSLSKALFDADFFRKTSRFKSETFKVQLDEIMKGASPEIKKRLSAIKSRVEGAERLVEGDAKRRACLEWGLAAGVGLMTSCGDMAKSRDGGAKTNLTKDGKAGWDWIRAEYRRYPKKTRAQIHSTVTALYQNKFGIPFPLALRTVERYFKRFVVDRT